MGEWRAEPRTVYSLLADVFLFFSTIVGCFKNFKISFSVLGGGQRDPGGELPLPQTP